MAEESTKSRVFRQNMRHVREGHQLSQGELARQLAEAGWPTLGHQTTVTRIESGARPARIDEAVAIADVLQVSLDKLLTAPKAVGALDTALDCAFGVREGHRQITKAIAWFLMERHQAVAARAEVVQRLQAGDYEGGMGKHVEEMLPWIDESLRLTIEDAVTQGVENWEQQGAEQSGDDDA